MASKRKLKKSISHIAEELFSEGLLLSWFSKDIDIEKIEDVLAEIIETEKEFIVRAGNPNGTKNKKLIKEYYKKLIQDINIHIEKIMNDYVKLQSK